MQNKSERNSSIPIIGRDPILGLNVDYEKDNRPYKVNAGVGVVIGEDGNQYMPQTIRNAMPDVSQDYNIGYISPTGESEWLGNVDYINGVVKYVFQDHAETLLANRQIAAVATAGGSRAISHFFDELRLSEEHRPLLLSNPSWPVHLVMQKVRNLEKLEYEHLDGNQYNLEAHLQAIKESPPHTAVLFQTGKSHNPTGVNPSTDTEWRQLARAMEGRTAFFDTAYAGLVDSHEDDIRAVNIFLEEGVQLAVALSFSKNAGLYKQRTGALISVLSNAEQALHMQRFYNYIARGVDSSPPAFGQETMAKVLNEPTRYISWQNEISEVAQTIKDRRHTLSEAIPQLNYLKYQSGLYALLPLEVETIDRLKNEFGIYMLSTGRINIGGIPSSQMPHVVSSLQEVLS